MSNVRRSVLAVMAGSNAATVINFLSGLVLARLLEPGEIGLFSMTAVFVGVMHTFRDFGVVSYLLREPDLTPEKVRSASGVLIACSSAIAITMLLLSGPVSRFYGHPQVEQIIQVLALGFFFIPLGSVTQSLLRREMEGGKLAAVTLFSAVVYAGSCIALAASGFGHMSMAWANFINIIAGGLAYSYFRPKWQPWLPSLKGCGAIARFGGVSAISNLLTNIHNALADTFLARGTDARSVGLYSRANGLVELFSQVIMPAVNNSALPALASSHRENASIAGDMIRIAVYLSGLAWPILWVTAVFAHDMVAVLYGDKWLACLPLVSLLCVSAAVRLPFSQTSNGLIAIGRPILSVWTMGATIVFKSVIAIASGAADMTSFVQAFVLGDLLVLPLMLAVWRLKFDVSLVAFARAMIPTLTVTVACAAVCHGIDLLMAGMNSWLRLFATATIMSATWIGAIFLLKHPLQQEIALIYKKIRRQ
ncbi:MAG: oligosaccharide flippase family protein [Rhodocyclaceae bacterium]